MLGEYRGLEVRTMTVEPGKLDHNKQVIAASDELITVRFSDTRLPIHTLNPSLAVFHNSGGGEVFHNLKIQLGDAVEGEVPETLVIQGKDQVDLVKYGEIHRRFSKEGSPFVTFNPAYGTITIIERLGNRFRFSFVDYAKPTPQQ